MKNKFFTRKNLTSDLALIFYFSLLKLLIHFYSNAFANYGYFRDELYYIACSKNLDWGYVDQPPFSIFILTVSRFVFGDSIFALRLLPAIAGALTVFFTGLIACEFGGRKWAIVLASTALILAPVHLGMNTIFSMNSFDILLWAVGADIIVLIIKNENSKLWMALGLIIGFGLLNKISFLWFGTGLFVGLLLTHRRKIFLTRWPYTAGIIAFVIFMPYIIWNLQHDLAHLEFIQNASGSKYSSQTPLTFLTGQFLIMNPFSSPIWFAGLYFLFFNKIGKNYKLIGIIFVTVLLILIINYHSKPEYLSSAYPMILAAGGTAIEKFSERKNWAWIKSTLMVLVITGGIIFAPIILPILPVESYVKYTKAIGFIPESNEGKELAEFPQFLSDMFGWKEKAKAVAEVYHSFTKEEQTKCAIFADNYGRCGAIDFFGEKYGLPKSIGRHNNYWIWGPRNYTGEIVIILGGDLEDKQEIFESVEIKGIVSCRYCMPYENNLRIYLCRNLKYVLKEFWPTLKHYD